MTENHHDESGKILDLDDPLPGLAAQANQGHEEAQIGAQSIVLGAVRAGNALQAAKKLLRHGEWLPWLAANFKADASTATRYIQVANHARLHDLDPSMTLTDTLRAISDRKRGEHEPTGEQAGLFDAAIECSDGPSGDDEKTSRSSDDVKDIRELRVRSHDDCWNPCGTMAGIDWLRILRVAESFASNDATDPKIHAVRLEAFDNYIVAVATDRFVIGWLRAEYDGVPFSVTLDLAHVDRLIRSANAAEQHLNPVWQVMIGVGDSPFGNMFGCCVGGVSDDSDTLVLPVSYEGFPDCRGVIAKAVDRKNDTVVCFRAEDLARFARVPAAKKADIVLSVSSPEEPASSPTLVKIGDGFFGAIAPRSTGAWEPPDWVAPGSDRRI